MRNYEPAGGDGTSDGPFDTLADAQTASGPGDTVFVFEGDGTATGLGDGIDLQQDQRLIGEVALLRVAGMTLHPGTPGARPMITRSGADVVALDSGNLARRVQLHPSGASGGIAGGAGDVGGEVDDVRIIDTGTPGSRPGLELDGTAGTFEISDLVIDNTAAGGAVGVRLASAGTVEFMDAGAISLRIDGNRALDVSATDLGAGSVFDEITVTGSPFGRLALVDVTGSTSLGDGVGVDLDLSTVACTSAAFLLDNADSVAVPEQVAPLSRLPAHQGWMSAAPTARP